MTRHLAPLRAPRVLAMPLAAAFAIAAVVLPVLPLALMAEPQSGEVTVSVGDVQVTPPGGDPVALNAGDTVVVGSVVTTGPGARAVVVITPRSAIRISENSEVLVEEVVEEAEPVRVMIDLKDGSVGALLKPAVGEQVDFRIRTPSGIAAARGTYFAVAVEDGKGFAQVKEGRLEIIPGGDEDDPN